MSEEKTKQQEEEKVVEESQVSELSDNETETVEEESQPCDVESTEADDTTEDLMLEDDEEPEDPEEEGELAGAMDDQDMEPEADPEEYFTALLSGLPEPIRNEYQGYGAAFREGYLALNRGDFVAAAAGLSRAMEEDPEGFHVRLELATAYLNLQRYGEARSLAEEFLAGRPDYLPGYEVLFESLWATEAFDEALERLDAAPAILSGTLPALLLHGETLLRAGRPREAERLLSGALDSGWNPEVAKSLARVYEAGEKKEQARDLYARLLPDCRTCGAAVDPFAKQRFADLSVELGDSSTRVLEILFSLVQEHPEGTVHYYEQIGRIYEARGEREEAARFRKLARQARE